MLRKVGCSLPCLSFSDTGNSQGWLKRHFFKYKWLISELLPGYYNIFMNWEILKLETVLENPLLNLDNVYFFFCHRIHFYSTDSKCNQCSTCVFWSQTRKESCLSKYIVDVSFGYLFHLTGGVKFFLKLNCIVLHLVTFKDSTTISQIASIS